MNPSALSFLRRIAPRTPRCHRILTGPSGGYRIVTSWQLYPSAIAGWTERGLLAWFEGGVAAGETWLDIGANFGYTAIALSRLVGPRGRVFAFEPKLSTAGCLSLTASANKFAHLTVVPMGLGTPETVTLKRVTTVRGMVDGIVELGDANETIVLARLDWLWPYLCGDREEIHGVKIDVQGMELEVLGGMRQLLATHHLKLLIEIHKNVDRDELMDLLESCGYARRGQTVETAGGGPDYIDNFSYVFTARNGFRSSQVSTADGQSI